VHDNTLTDLYFFSGHTPPTEKKLETGLIAVRANSGLVVGGVREQQMDRPRGRTWKAFKRLDESPDSNELGFLARAFWYS
jgi:hypothetical protein